MARPRPGCSTLAGTRRGGTGCYRPYALRFSMGRPIGTALNLTIFNPCSVQRSCHARAPSGLRLKLAQGLPERGLGVFGANQAASLQGRHEAFADLVDILAAELPLPGADQETIAADLRHDLSKIVRDLLRRAHHPVEAAGRAIECQLPQRLARALLHEGIERALLAIGGDRKSTRLNS